MSSKVVFEKLSWRRDVLILGAAKLRCTAARCPQLKTWRGHIDPDHADAHNRVLEIPEPLICEENMRIPPLYAMLPLIAFVPAMAASLSSSAPSGVKKDVAGHNAYNQSCVAQRVVVTITTPPANGTATTTIETKIVPLTARLGGPQPCAGASLPTAVVYYQSNPNFKGTDQFKYQRINQDNPKDRLNGEVVLTVTVK